MNNLDEKSKMQMDNVYKSVLVMMSTYNGELYLKEQLESIITQKDVELHLLIRDDGSSDSTIEIIEDFKRTNKNIQVIKEGNLGAAKGFMRLLEIARNLERKFDYYAFSDQDDVWLNVKLKVAIERLENLNFNGPKIYCSKPQLVNEILEEIPTQWIDLNCTFGESMIVNGALGCTEVFNKELFNLITCYKPSFLAMHDAWIYRVCLATGGKVYYDENSYILYRQHSNNVIGGKSSFRLKWKRRILAYLKNNKNVRLQTAREILLGYNNSLTKENRELLKLIVDYPKSKRNKYRLLKNGSLRCLSTEHNVIFKLAVLLKIY